MIPGFVYGESPRSLPGVRSMGRRARDDDMKMNSILIMPPEIWILNIEI